MKRVDLLKELMKTGHCKESIAAIHNTQDKAELLMQAYFYYIKECTKKDFPAIDVLRAQFGKDVAPWGGYIDANGIVPALKRNAFVGNCDASIVTDLYNIVHCWVRHNSKLKVVASGHSRVHVDCFENGDVHIHIEDKAKVYVRQYGDSKVLISGNVAGALVTTYDCKTYK